MQRDLSFDPLSLRCRSLNPCLDPLMQICTTNGDGGNGDFDDGGGGCCPKKISNYIFAQFVRFLSLPLSPNANVDLFTTFSFESFVVPC